MNIEFADVTVKKGDVTVLRDISIRLSERRIGVIGRNGSGKSTFARLFNGIEVPASGAVLLDGVPERKNLRRHVGFVFQNPDNQIVYPIVEEDLAFGLKNLKLPKAEIEERIGHAMRSLGLDHLRTRLTHQLSGGEKQMIALVGALVMHPRMIVFDEPTTLLDLWNKQKFMETINALPQHVVVVSHDLDLLRGFDRIVHIEAGRIVADGDPAKVLDNYIASSQC
ncbi:energy-coupling factor ABC transporter ATP-binding protein [uncultured Sulfitobacter sp.]|uniref:energy-coupling factor ABC transporter ATP-binding protein n=1 Tax=uncultured Sulfitobacter sp. TaxID=191468 RepID=UPI0026235958|nr:energy-coupling factor ABC transporter ATP-binding protein [uncultured Sulfitobacter sp.]